MSTTNTTTPVRVALRVRPLFENELDKDRLIKFNQDQIYVGNDKSFTFDSVYSPISTQQDIFDTSIAPLLHHFIEGKNVTILAYGQTGSGKTYSLGTGSTDSTDRGIIPRFATMLFNNIIDEQEVYISFLELYNEDIIDLLSTTNNQIMIREDTNGNIHCLPIQEQRIHSVNELLNLLKVGSLKRTTGTTKLNQNSSRSHAIFSIQLKQPLKALVSKFHFVDLAGSERLKRTNAMGDRQKEGIFINGGLLALGNVISALGDEKSHVPYRDSKLTRLLQDSLGGNSHTLMLACISPSNDDYFETLNTLKYANRARQIQNDVKINHQEVDQVTSLKAEIDQLVAHSQKLTQQLASTQIELDSIRLTQDKTQLEPIIQKYNQELQQLKFELLQAKHNKKLPSSVSASRKKKPVFQRMKTQSAPSSHKRKNSNQQLYELFDLLNDNSLQPQQFESHEKPFIQSENPISLEDDELEALAVPSWTDAPKTQSNNESNKRQSVSLDSMWDDTDSSITTSNMTTSPVWEKPKQKNTPPAKDTKRQSRNLIKMLHQIQADVLVKKELVGQLEKTEDQYAQMRTNYEQRLNELKTHLFEIQEQRDVALQQQQQQQQQPRTVLKRPSSVYELRENRVAQEVRSQYEVKIKRLSTDNSELKRKATQLTQQLEQLRLKSETTINRYKAETETLKLDNKKLARQLKQEVDKSRESKIEHQKEIQHYKRRVMVAIDAKKKSEETNQIQSQTIKKRTEETAAAQLQLRQLLNALRKAATEGSFLNEATLEKLLTTNKIRKM